MAKRIQENKTYTFPNATTGTYSGESLDSTLIDGVSIIVTPTNITGTLAGTANIQVSNDNKNWVTIGSIALTSTSVGAAAAPLSFRWYRGSVSVTGGTANLLLNLCATAGD